MLKVTNVRLGFANNSSSSHSILLCNVKEHGETDNMVDEFLGDDEPYFGWERFVCASPEAKAKYFACQLAEVLRTELGNEVAGLTVNALLGVPKKYGKGLVDHQSQMMFPCYSNGKLAIAFIEELFNQCINDPRVVIAGGNDNEDEGCPVDTLTTSHPWCNALPRDQRRTDIIARPEPYGWCLFNKTTGAKIRLEREGAVNQLPKTPELVDLCLTKKCHKKCDFCYQSSDYKGEHADEKWIDSLIYTLAKMQIFEVVLGGGEPTLHPDFLKILGRFAYSHIVPNFTTASCDWLCKPEFVAEVVKHTGSIAFSCNNLWDIRHFGRMILLAGEELANKAVFQSIVGIVKPSELAAMIKLANDFGFHKYSLVGFKQSGRAPKQIPYAPNKYDLEEMIKKTEMRYYADTALLQQFPEIVEKYTCDTAEGKHSMYIDGVAKTMAMSSYTGDVISFERKDYPQSEEIQAAFTKFQSEIDQISTKE